MTGEQRPDRWHIHVNAADDLEICDKSGRVVVRWAYAEDCRNPRDPDIIAAAPELLDGLEEALRLMYDANPSACEDSPDFQRLAALVAGMGRIDLRSPDGR